jgi:hypothetical protein
VKQEKEKSPEKKVVKESPVKQTDLYAAFKKEEDLYGDYDEQRIYHDY